MGFSMISGQLAKEFAQYYGTKTEHWDNIVEGPLYDKSGPNTVFQTNGKDTREILVISATKWNPRVIVRFPLYSEPCGNPYVLANTFADMPKIILLHRPNMDYGKVKGWLGAIFPSDDPEGFVKKYETVSGTSRKSVTGINFDKDRTTRQDDALYSDGFHYDINDRSKGLIPMRPTILKRMDEFGCMIRGTDWPTRRPING